MYGFILMLAGIPVYLFMMLQNNKKDKLVDNLRKDAGVGSLDRDLSSDISTIIFGLVNSSVACSIISKPRYLSLNCNLSSFFS